MIPFNKPLLVNNEIRYITDSVASGKISGDGKYTKLCHKFFEKEQGFKKALLTTSCTDALEMAAILIDIKPGDEVIAPSYTFVSTVNAFVLRGAKIVFADSYSDNPNIDPDHIEKLITSKTKAIVVVHYAGVACDMDRIMNIASENSLFVVEDAAQAIDSYYKGKRLGSIGDFGAFSFHETKNIIAGEGGLLTINKEQYTSRAEIIREKGTNRTSFFRGEVDKYGWVDIGSSFLPSDMIAAYLFAQLESIDLIQTRRKELWLRYYEKLSNLELSEKIHLPVIPDYATNNAHMFYIVCSNLDERSRLIAFLKDNKVSAVFHYISLHKSPYFEGKYSGEQLLNCDKYSDQLVRLPLYYELKFEEVDFIVSLINKFYIEG
ncbi:dTDP-4-amino-4,6-dideoxygalactose transaminase [Alishewanella sp. 16-MA]|uniref:dTDP-4-amino-4,6-dideoxygalactose transaminase n=1 Tax=Alishewanella maricola TaxID=2795740 RepID=A0ABS8C183_9ALTE|nr:dTDP-4-amino-4,6-dideoxygalactose transaminase [Alishewanella maricola]MCB5226069.1 dTDP-4-amino-4,6-dideoxygalactose transaminase [Alishewanella maricola]